MLPDIPALEDIPVLKEFKVLPVIQVHYGIKWDSMTHFDLVIDTSKIPHSSAIPMIIEANKAVMKAICEPRESASSIEVDDILLEATRKVIEN